MSVIKQRYAEALLAATHSPQEANAIGEAFSGFSRAFQQDQQLSEFFLSPVIKMAIKKETLAKFFPESKLPVNKLAVNFLSLLLDKGRFGFFPEIAEEYIRLKDVLQKNLEIKVFSAMPLDESQINKMIEKYKTQFGAVNAYVTLKIDPSVIGGVHIQIGDVRMDDTQSGRLNALMQFISGTE